MSALLTGSLYALKRQAENHPIRSLLRGRAFRPGTFAAALGELTNQVGLQLRFDRPRYDIEVPVNQLDLLIDTLHERLRGELRGVLADGAAAPAVRMATREEWDAVAGLTLALEAALAEQPRTKPSRAVAARWAKERLPPREPKPKARPKAKAKVKSKLKAKTRSKPKPKPKSKPRRR
ncbi:MAG: hypothetical protein FJX46_13355 [Alphaproteobacteria bacterium]|nr:hypothetical protein [Alphaproteobacteria bacterium]